MEKTRICPICNRTFGPSKYRKDQVVCSRAPCQKIRQRENLARWREKNPGYFKTSRHDTSWAQVYRERARKWRKRHKGKIREYRKARREELKEYMRVYMYRLRHSKG